MQFNSFIFILLFLPLTIGLYFWVSNIKLLFGKIVIIVASVIFFIYSDWRTAIIMSVSLLINLLFAYFIQNINKWRSFFTVMPIVINISLLLYFKYFNFFVSTVNQIWGGKFRT